MTAKSIRARVRDELTSEIKAIARRQLATEGANLSLRAVARELGMVSSAVYRYFPSRDDLLTALIIDCYDELGAAAETAESAVDRADLLGRWLAAGHGIRDWALANPAEYALIYGSPVPGYQAPRTTIGPAARTTDLILTLLADGVAAGTVAVPAAGTDPPLSPLLAAELDRIAALACPTVPRELLSRGTTAWIQLFGVVTFELFGRFQNMIEEGRRDFFDRQLRVMAAYVGLR
ncbi:TetR/AcrR family transcriptional regulator [Catellatospora bangladeshensis]|uniref:TetR family transcriptional regulator n=1 Tax=Catellatospora bangladeshensis TaxID=310355 RepID=A0A8J3JG31_9ACTN|nr:TetR/AcrR family transcriptional regulator [Catellatospora bangladeshensis]GIF79996.1 TetR family transcriptional regulator [Catellatospora bangladeshensis]